MTGAGQTVLVVDDDEAVRDEFTSWLDEYEVATADTAAAALDQVATADVVLLDRRLPDRPGDAVAAEIAAMDDRPMVAVVSGVAPDTNILDLACDDYLVKPLRPEELRDAVARLGRRAEYDSVLAEYSRLAAKRAAIEAANPMEELVGDPEYDRLCTDGEAIRRELDGMVEQFSTADFETAFRAPEFSAE